jgi:hypothetical protein
MFGELALSERAIASQGVMFFGSETVTSEFTQTTDGVAVLSGLLEMSSTTVQSAFAAGLAAGIAELSMNFTKTTVQTVIRTNSADLTFTFENTEADPTLIASGVSELSGNFTQTTQANFTASGVSEQSGNFTQTSDGNLVASGLSTQIANADVDDIPPKIVRQANADIVANFEQDTDGILILKLAQTMDLEFAQSTLGEILYELLQTDSTVESWTDLSTGASATWTDLQASAAESWTDVTR